MVLEFVNIGGVLSHQVHILYLLGHSLLFEYVPLHSLPRAVQTLSNCNKKPSEILSL